MPATLPCTGVVLAGGASTRMGTDKAFIEIDGAPMAVRAAAALRAAGVAHTFVVGGDGARLRGLGLVAVADRYPGEGPLGGVITALEALDSMAGGGSGAVVTLPCDVVEPDADAVRCVLDRFFGIASDAAAAAPAADLVVPLGDGVPQWMHSVWRRGCLSRLSEAFARGVRAPRDAACELRTVAVDVPGSRWFRDADRPEDLPAELQLRPAAAEERGWNPPRSPRST